MAGQDQIKPVGDELFHPERVMHQENISGPALWHEWRMFGAQPGRTQKCKLPVGRYHLLVHEPGATACRKTFGNAFKGCLAPKVVIAWNSVYGGFYLRENL